MNDSRCPIASATTAQLASSCFVAAFWIVRGIVYGIVFALRCRDHLALAAGSFMVGRPIPLPRLSTAPCCGAFVAERYRRLGEGIARPTTVVQPSRPLTTSTARAW